MPRAAALRIKDQRIARRATGRSFRTAFVTVFMLGTMSSAAFAFYQYADQSDYFRVKTIQIDGADLIKAEDIAALSGVSNEDNILFVRPSVVKARVEANPYIAQCTVTRTFPDLVRIAIDERYPVATLLAHNHAYEIDADLNVLRRMANGEPNTGPLISQISDVGAVEPGMQLTQAPLRIALQIWDAFSETAMSREVTVSEIAAAGINEIRMYCDDLPYEIRWGRDDVVRQARNLDTLWKQRGKELPCTEYLDLRFGQDLACK